MTDPTGEERNGFYYLGNARHEEQVEEMRRLQAAGVCLFCPATLATDPGQRVLRLTEWWTVARNRYPYRGTAQHLLLVPAVHASDIADLPLAAKAEFWDVLDWVKQEFSLDHYGLGVRCGDCRFTGGTIEHVHIHIVVGQPDADDFEPVRMKLTSRPVDAS